MPGTRKLGRKTQPRMQMLRGQVTYLLDIGYIETTVTRAKEVRALAEKMITLGKKRDLASYRAALAFITKESVVKKLFDTVAPSLSDRAGGYTEIFRTGYRRGDGAPMAIIKLVNFDIVKQEADKKAERARRAEERAKKAEDAAEDKE
ncbi:MAG TPA: 50S ribosomal protein L17 [Clostridiales bacterium]|nr:50S ribosomal protein L17 [Clostridiales bacterium]